MEQKEVEKVAAKYILDNFEIRHISLKDVSESFKAGAEWHEATMWIKCSEIEPENYEDKHFRTANDKLPIRMPINEMRFYYTLDKIEWLEENG